MPYQETVKYIKEQIDKGIEADKIRRALENSGYQLDVIDELMQKAGVVKEEKKSAGGIEKIFRDIGLGVVLLLILSTVIYLSFFRGSGSELMSPAEKNIKVDFSKISNLNLDKNIPSTINLNNYVNDKIYGPSQITWKYDGKKCINIQIIDNIATLRSVFLPGCPIQEKITFTATNPEGEMDSDVITIKII